MNDNKRSTDYAPAERASEGQINQEADLLIALPLLGQLLDSIPDIVLILNEQRQIVFANQALADAFDITDRRGIYGLRPGEALQCIHADETICGCGTTSFCKTCGAVNAILSGLRGKKKTEECRISQKNTGIAFDFRVTATPFKASNASFVIFVATDISHEKRRNVLERTFFHDISNTLAGVVGYADLLPISSINKQKDLLEQLAISVHRLQAEINSQRGLISAEIGDLSVCPQSVRSREFLHEMVTFYKKGGLSSASVQIDLDDTSIDIMFVSDKTLISRVFGNMLKNALEASQPADKVLAGCRLDSEMYICFWVQNAQFMPPDIQLQIFNRSFSTKGKGRGIGTYSMKLLTEKYLKGKVAFSTAHEQGTIFSVTLPLILE
ncbi:MAG: PAS domain-containing sensor histidine kinase [Pseudomonadota bacterium]